MEYIEREAAITELNLWSGKPYGWGKAVIERVPAADVSPVVRCKDCLAYESADGFCNVHADYMTEDDYCSRGTKRE